MTKSCVLWSIPLRDAERHAFLRKKNIRILMFLLQESGMMALFGGFFRFSVIKIML